MVEENENFSLTSFGSEFPPYFLESTRDESLRKYNGVVILAQSRALTMLLNATFANYADMYRVTAHRDYVGAWYLRSPLRFALFPSSSVVSSKEVRPNHVLLWKVSRRNLSRVILIFGAIRYHERKLT